MNKIVITEDIEEKAIKSILAEVFVPDAGKVNLIRDYLNKNFRHDKIPDINDDGYPIQTDVFSLISNGQALKIMKPKEFLRMLDDKFHNIIKDDNDRKNFLKRIIEDWANNKISKSGVLSVNTI